MNNALLSSQQINHIAREARPCDGCNQGACQTDQTACWDYNHWLNTGTVRRKHRTPSRRIYLIAHSN